MFPMNLFHHNPTTLDARVKALPRAEPTPKRSFRARYIIPLAIIVALAGAATPVYGKALYRYVSNYFSGNNIIVPIVSPTPEPTYRLTPTPENTPTLENKVTPTPEPTPTITPTPTLEAKLFEFVCDNCTDNQRKTYNENTLADYREVLKFYPIKEQDARMVVAVGEIGYGANFYWNGIHGTGVGLGLDDFVKDRREVKEEMAHAINQTLFQPKDRDAPWYNLFNEGSTQYISGQINRDGGNEYVDLAGLNKDGTINPKASGGVPADEAYALLKENPELFWRRRATGNYVAGHVMGTDFFNLAIRGGLTPEKFRDIIVPELQRHSKNGGLSKEGIQKSFEAAGVNINYDWIEKGIEVIYLKK